MARTFTLPSIRAQARARADMQSTSAQAFIPDAELSTYINQSYCELYDLLVSAGGMEYYMNQASIPTLGNIDTYDLPNDFYRLLGADAVLNGNQAVTLQPFNFNERNLYRSVYSGGWGIDYNLRYRIVQNLKIKFIPIPLNSINITLWYIPACPVLGDTDLADGVDGFEELLVVDAAIKMLEKEESDVTVLMARKAELVARISAMAPNRDGSAAERVRDVDVELLTAWPWF